MSLSFFLCLNVVLDLIAIIFSVWYLLAGAPDPNPRVTEMMGAYVTLRIGSLHK